MTIYVTPKGIAHTHLIRFRAGPEEVVADTGDWSARVPFPDNVRAIPFLLTLRPHQPAAPRLTVNPA